MIKQKKRNYKREKATALASDNMDPKTFWKEVKDMGCRNDATKASNNITIDEWYDHFKDVFGNNVNDQECELPTFDQLEEPDHILNTAITEEEVKYAIKKLKCGKASGLDGVNAEMLKLCGEEVILFLTSLFNVIFEEGTYPQEWAKAIIIPLHKKR